MSFKFASICNYLQVLEQITCHDPPLLPAEQKSRTYRHHAAWFATHRAAVDALDERGTTALLSSFLPLRRKDRIYGLQSASLFKLLGRSLALSASATQELASFKTSGNGDLGESLQRLLQARGPPALPPVTLQDVDDTLHALAAGNRFSAQSVRQSFRPWANNDSPLADVLLRLHPVESKWFVRLILKNLAPLSLTDHSILQSIHFLLPDLLAMQDNFESACSALKSTFGAYPSRPDPQSMRLLRQTAVLSLKPATGIKVSRPEYSKARSIKHCLQMTAGVRWLVERKYDGEYCQIHIDLDKGDDWLKIYSKSGRDSTDDRVGLRETIKRCLRIGTAKCKFKRQCILAGEMVVFSDTENRILGFDSIRSHVSRAGVFLGTENDSPGHADHHLMIILFDLLLLDDRAVLTQSVEERKAALSGIYKKIHGRAVPAESCVMDFSQANAEKRLMSHFAASIACRHEGLVLKPCGVPYLGRSFDLAPEQQPQNTVAGIKLKKDYIAGLGDEADFAVVGASYNAQEASKRTGLRLKYTHFHLGCLLNKELIHQDGVKPRFKIVATIAYDQCMSTEILERVNIEGSLLAEPYSKAGPATFTIESDVTFQMDFCFRDPLVFEVLGSSYSKPPGGFFMLRHPRVKKLHRDRAWRDCITFDELQSAAAEALNSPQDSESQENINWISKLEMSHKRKFARLSLNTTPRSSNDNTTPRSIHSDMKCTPLSVRSDMTSAPNTGSPLLDFVPVEGIDVNPPLQFRMPLSHQEHALPTPPDSSPLCKYDTSRPAALLKRKSEDGEDVVPKRCRSYRKPSQSKTVHQQARLDDGQEPSRTPLAATTPNVPSKAVKFESSKYRARKPSLMEGYCKFEQATACGQRKVCIFSQSVVYIGGLDSIEKERVRRKVLEHGAVLIQDLSYWERDSRGQEQDSSTVCESQAYKGLRKIVLVDPRERQVYGDCYTEIERLELHRVELFDYRIVDAMCSGDADQGRTVGKGIEA